MSENGPRGAVLRKLASRTNLAVAVVLVAVKLMAWIRDRLSRTAHLGGGCPGDAGASLETYFGVRYAERPPDREHRFGHGKGESVAGSRRPSFWRAPRW